MLSQGPELANYVEDELGALLAHDAILYRAWVDAEMADLVTFMKEGLASSAYPDVAAPELPK